MRASSEHRKERLLKDDCESSRPWRRKGFVSVCLPWERLGSKLYLQLHSSAAMPFSCVALFCSACPLARKRRDVPTADDHLCAIANTIANSLGEGIGAGHRKR